MVLPRRLWLCESPALLIQTSTPPNCCLMLAKRFMISESLVKSHFTAVRLPGIPDSSFERALGCKEIKSYIYISKGNYFHNRVSAHSPKKIYGIYM